MTDVPQPRISTEQSVTASAGLIEQRRARLAADAPWSGGGRFLSGMIARQAGRVISLATGARLTILIYHRVLGRPDPLSPATPDVRTFEWAMRMAREQMNVLPLPEAIAKLRQGELPLGSAAITFDDGYADNATLALPVLRRLGLSATFFVSTGFIGGGRMWNDTVTETFRACTSDVFDLSDLGLGAHVLRTIADRRAALAHVIGKLKYLAGDERESITERIASRAQVRLPGDLMMVPDQVRELCGAGMTVGAHTVNHPILSRLEVEEATREINKGKQALESMIDQPVELFAYPNGKPGEDYTSAHVGIVRRAGFLAAVSTAHGAATRASDFFQLPRFTPRRTDPLGFRGQLLRNLFHTQPSAV